MNSVLFLYIYFFASRFSFAYLQVTTTSLSKCQVSSFGMGHRPQVVVILFFMLEDISNFESPIDAQNLKKHPCSGAYYVFLSTLLNHRHPISSQTQTTHGKSEHQFCHILSLNFGIIVRLLWLDCPSHATQRSKKKWSFLFASIFSFQCW